jgi:hypothetical protein
MKSSRGIKHRLNKLEMQGGKFLFFKKISFEVKTKKRLRLMTSLLKNKNSLVKIFHNFKSICMIRRLHFYNKEYKKLYSVKNEMFQEKSLILNKIESENNDLKEHYQTEVVRSKNLYEENEFLRRKIAQLEIKLDQDNKKFQDLWTKNVEDIKSNFIRLKNRTSFNFTR